GDQVPAGLSRCDTRRCVGALRADTGRGAERRGERADVQFLSRRDQIGDRDGGNRQRLRLGSTDRRPQISAVRRRRSAQLLRSGEVGGVLDHDGMVEVVSCLERDGRPVFRDLRWGVYVVVKAPTAYARACFKEYGLKTDANGWYAAMYKPYHLIGLE